MLHTRFSRRSITMLLGAVVLAVAATAPAPASAAAPSLTANPTQVTLPSALATGQTTISWNTGGGPGQVKVQIDDGPLALWKQGKGGQQVYAGIQAGKTYRFRLYSKQGTLLAGPLTVTATVQGGGPGCTPTSQCITQVAASTAGIVTTFHVETNAPATLYLEISGQSATHANGNFVSPLGPFFNSGGPTTAYNFTLTAIPSGPWFYHVRATQADGQFAQVYGPFSVP